MSGCLDLRVFFKFDVGNTGLLKAPLRARG